MKTKVSLKSVKNDPLAITIALPYCSASTLLKNHEPLFYNAGVYGWNCDIYRITVDGTVFNVVTGYRFSGVYRVSYDLVNRFERAAADCVTYYGDHDIPENVSIDSLVDSLLSAFLLKVKHDLYIESLDASKRH